jgi:hypothetical protein
MRLYPLQNKTARQRFTHFWIKAQIKEGLMNLVCDSGVTFFTLLEKFEDHIPFYDAVFEDFGCARLFNLG